MSKALFGKDKEMLVKFYVVETLLGLSFINAEIANGEQIRVPIKETIYGPFVSLPHCQGFLCEHGIPAASYHIIKHHEKGL